MQNIGHCCLILVADLGCLHVATTPVPGVLLSYLALLDPLWRRGMQSRGDSGSKYSRPDNGEPPGRGWGVDCTQKIEEQEDEASKLKGRAV